MRRNWSCCLLVIAPTVRSTRGSVGNCGVGTISNAAFVSARNARKVLPEKSSSLAATSMGSGVRWSTPLAVNPTWFHSGHVRVRNGENQLLQRSRTCPRPQFPSLEARARRSEVAEMIDRHPHRRKGERLELLTNQLF